MHQGEGEKIGGTLFETHLAWQQDNFQLRASTPHGTLTMPLTVSKQVQMSRPVSNEPSQITDKIGVFARLSEYDNTAAVLPIPQLSNLILA